MRLYEMFIGDFEKAAPWNSSSIKGCKRFVDRTWALADVLAEGGIRGELETAFHKTIKKVTFDIDALKGNTAIAALMTLLNQIEESGRITRGEMEVYLILLNPFAPHVTEELWEKCGFPGQLNAQKWPAYDEEKCREDSVEIAVQVNGKIKARITVPADIGEADAVAAARADAKMAAALEGMQVLKEIYVGGKLVNIVARPR